MIFLFIIKLRLKIVRNTIHDIPVYNQTSCKNRKKYNSIFLLIIKPRVRKVRNTNHDIPVYNQTSCKNKKEIKFMIFQLQNQTSCKKLRNRIHGLFKPRLLSIQPVYNQTSCKKNKKYNS